MTIRDIWPVLSPMLFAGLRLTILIAVFGILIGFAIGSIAGYALQARSKVARVISYIYIWLIRGTPLVVQALYIYYVIPGLFSGVRISSTAAGIAVIAINSGAFIAEVVRGALQGVDVGQREAGASIGLTHFQVLIHLIIPPALRQMLPSLFNQFIISVKDTSLLTIIVVNEMTQKAMNYAAMTFQFVPVYTMLALFYLSLISVLMLIQKVVERNMSAPPKPKRTSFKEGLAEALSE